MRSRFWRFVSVIIKFKLIIYWTLVYFYHIVLPIYFYMYLTEYTNGHAHLEESVMYESDGKLFLTEAFNVIMEEILHKGTDLKEKVKSYKNLSSHLTTSASSYLILFLRRSTACLCIHRCVSGKIPISWELFWTLISESMENLTSSYCRGFEMWPDTVLKPVCCICWDRIPLSIHSSSCPICFFQCFILKWLYLFLLNLEYVITSWSSAFFLSQVILCSSISCLLAWTTMHWQDGSSRKPSTPASMCEWTFSCSC